jgi:tetratricopeptide (TPR) repeat protein
MEKDRAYFGLGMIALAGHQEDEAMKWFARFEKETLGSGLLANVAEIKADLFTTDRKYAEAQKEYERIIEMPTAGRQTKARMLLKLGDLMTTQREDKKATAYYERVYVSYAKYRPEVASAYSKRAAALQRLGLTEKATEVYAELALREDLATLPESIQAVSLLNKQDPEWRLKRLKTEGVSTP